MKALTLAMTLAAAILVGAAVVFLPRRPMPPARKAVKTPHLTPMFAVPVLMYHRISPLSEAEARSPLTRDLTVSPEDFETQVAYLAKNGFTFLYASQIENAIKNNLPLPERSVAITMDDGYKDNFEFAFPILRKYGARATVFLVSSTIDSPRHLAWKDLFEMNGSVSYGSHTVHHYDLTTLRLDELRYELTESKRLLEARLATPITGLAYPAGSFNNQVLQFTEAAGYVGAWKKGGGPVQPDAKQFLLPRVRVHGRTDFERFKRIAWSGIYTILERKQAANRFHATMDGQQWMATVGDYSVSSFLSRSRRSS